MKMLGIPGSIRPNSYNKAFLVWVGKLLKPMGVELEVVEINEMPIPLGARETVPEIVAKFKKKVKDADAVIFSTPQYNYSFPESLRSTIDWVAFPSDDNCWSGRKGFIMGVSRDTAGVIKAEVKLKEYMRVLGMEVFDGESIAVERAGEILDEEGGLLDKKIELKTKKVLEEFVQWVKK